MTRSVSARDARIRFAELIHHVNTENEEVILTNHGKPRAVLMSHAAYEELRLWLMHKRKLDVLDERKAVRQRVRARRIPS